MITTGGAINEGAKKGQSSWYTLLGYMFHLGNTFCMVSCSFCVTKRSFDLEQALYVLLQKKFVFMKSCKCVCVRAHVCVCVCT